MSFTPATSTAGGLNAHSVSIGLLLSVRGSLHLSRAGRSASSRRQASDLCRHRRCRCLTAWFRQSFTRKTQPVLESKLAARRGRSSLHVSRPTTSDMARRS